MNLFEDTSTIIDPAGLRYHSKVPGSPFAAAGAFGTNTMSCFLCGRHRPRASLVHRRVIGRSRLVCGVRCGASGERLDAERGDK